MSAAYPSEGTGGATWNGPHGHIGGRRSESLLRAGADKRKASERKKVVSYPGMGGKGKTLFTLTEERGEEGRRRLSETAGGKGGSHIFAREKEKILDLL